MEQSSFELPRLDLELFARKLVDHRYTNLSSTDPVAQLRGQIPLDLLPRSSYGCRRARD